MIEMKSIVFILLILLICSCEKDEPEDKNRYSNINETLKNNFSFIEGSYWVYQDGALNMDSVVLVNRETGFTSSCPDNACFQYEFVKLKFDNVIKGTSFNHLLISDYIKYNGGGDWGQNGQPIFIHDKAKGHRFNGLTVCEKIDSLIIFNTTFYNVEKMSIQADMQFQPKFQYDREFYFVPSIGIVRMVINDTVNGTIIRDLKNYNIE